MQPCLPCRAAQRKQLAHKREVRAQFAVGAEGGKHRAAVDAVQKAAQQQGVSPGGDAGQPGPNGNTGATGATSGQWYRRGRTIVIVGL